MTTAAPRHPRPKRRKKLGPNVWVVRRDGQYSVKEEGSGTYLTAPVAQHTAIAIARLVARANCSELIVQGEAGRIRQRDSHGNDPIHSPG
jgi:hypothetical protein